MPLFACVFLAACFTSGRLTMPQLQPLKRSISPPPPPLLRIPITEVAELNGFNAGPHTSGAAEATAVRREIADASVVVCES